MSLSTTARVGLLTWITIAATVGGLGWLTQLGTDRVGYPLQCVFPDVNGLLPGANVLLMGVRVGKVRQISPRQRDVLVDLWITDPAVGILEGSRFKILNKGIIGEKNLEIFPPTNVTSRERIAPGTTLMGQRPDRLDAVLEEALTAVRKVRALADSPEMRQVLGDARETVSGVKTLVEQLEVLTVRATTLVEQGGSGLTHIQGTTLPAVDRTIETTRGTLESARGTIDEIRGDVRVARRALEALDLEGATGTDTREAIASLKNLVTRLDGMAARLDQVTRDPRIGQGIGALIDTSRRVVAQASAVATGPFKVTPLLDLAGVSDGKTAYLIGGGGLDATIGLQRFQLGIEQIGDGNFWTATWGRDDLLHPGMGVHVGLIRSRLGGGLSWNMHRDAKIRAEIFSPQAPLSRLTLEYGSPDWQTRMLLTASWLHALDAQEPDRIFLGVRWRPLD